MGQAAGPAASGLSLSSMGLSAFSSIEGAEGTKSADDYKAEELDRASQYGELKAVQTGGQMTRNLNMTLGNIDAVRAAGHTDPTSPTGAAVRNQIEGIGTEQKNIRVDSLNAQAQEDEANAAYMRSAGSSALLGGEIGAAGGILKGIAGIPGI